MGVFWNVFHPKNPDASNLAILRTQNTLQNTGSNPSIGGSMILTLNWNQLLWLYKTKWQWWEKQRMHGGHMFPNRGPTKTNGFCEKVILQNKRNSGQWKQTSVAHQAIQTVTFLSPNVGGHQQPCKGVLFSPSQSCPSLTASKYIGKIEVPKLFMSMYVHWHQFPTPIFCWPKFHTIPGVIKLLIFGASNNQIYGNSLIPCNIALSGLVI